MDVFLNESFFGGKLCSNQISLLFLIIFPRISKSITINYSFLSLSFFDKKIKYCLQEFNHMIENFLYIFFFDLFGEIFGDG